MSKINIAILIDSEMIERYKFEIFSEIEKRDFCDIVKIEVVPSPKEKNSGWKYAMYRMLSGVDHKYLSGELKYLEKISLSEKITDCSKNNSKPDLVINLTSQPLTDTYGAKYGMWQYIHKSYPVGFWEVIHSKPYTEVALTKASGALFDSYLLESLKTVTNDRSVTKNLEQIMWRSHQMIIRNLERLKEQKNDFYEEKKERICLATNIKNDNNIFTLRQSLSDKKYFYPPTNLNALPVYFNFLKKYFKLITRKILHRKRDGWIILYKESEKLDLDFATYKKFYPEHENSFVADPFVIDEGEKTYLFYEELSYADEIGYLRVAEYDFNAKEFKKPRTILKEKYHLSWPNVFKIDGKYYMVPESFNNKTVDLYEATDFPYTWKKKKTLLDNLEAADATFLKKDNRWWMFVNIAEKEGFDLNDELYIYSTDDFLNGEWKAHKQNPVISDVTHARPAGNIIEANGNLYRPAQDCSGIYGRRIVVSKIVKLNEFEYEEESIGILDTSFSKEFIAMHTLNKSSRIVVTDVYR